PRAMIHEPNYDFSFSGLKSAFINVVHNADQRGEQLDRADLAASFQASVVDVLVAKVSAALDRYPVKQLVLAGGVAANHGLRDALKVHLAKVAPQTKLVAAPLALCGDNAAMIGAAAHIAYAKGDRADMSLNADPSLEFPWLAGVEA
ncbi:MAG TPA: tRNA (adenosine(37)-N6)-threonylcarbamoyltransferase complex transferase subunit TsaD, partial [Lactobacillus sp.]|nr:tRNA (adenosine(37)-N6)-threonylcarbamoyltransferase complex transferase subunit TsaD [Lactobacillus sp.]